MDQRTTALLADVRALFNDRVETAGAPGGRLVVFPSCRDRVVSLRKVFTLARRYGKDVRVSITAETAELTYFDVTEDNAVLPAALTAADAVDVFKRDCIPPVTTSRNVRPAVAGTTDVVELEIGERTTIPATLIARWFDTPFAFDVQVAAGRARLLSARPSQLRNSLAALLKANKLHVACKRPARKCARRRRKRAMRVVRR